ncbi:hypothetical protein JCM10212_007136 [Sporobolomyces blumeae]
MSRRDEVVDSLDTLVNSFRSQLSTAIQNVDARTASTSRPATSSPSLGARLSSLLDLPPPTSNSTSPATAQQGAVPFSSARHTSIPIERPAPSSSSSPYQASGSGSTPLGSTSVGSLPEVDALPSYSRRAPVSRDLLSTLPSKRLHLLTSRTGKLHLELEARGKEHVVLIQEEPDGQTDLTGTLKVSLKEPEAVTHVKIRLKGIVRTLVMKAHASGRHPVSDEITFHESASTLYTTETFLAENESSDPSKLLGSFAFPFALSVPSRIRHYTSSAIPATAPVPLARPIRPPPSFMLDTHSTARRDQRDGLGPGGLSTGGFEVSCRYFLKVTLGRKGLLKVNERWIIPVVFVPRQARPPISPSRALALARHEDRVPHSPVDPVGWTDPGKYKMRRTVKKGPSSVVGAWARRAGGSGSNGSAEVEIEGKTIRGHKVERGDAGSPGGTGNVPFEVSVTTTNPSVTGKIKPSMINVFLVQRVAITAQRLTNAQDVVVARATSMHPIGTASNAAALEGYPVELGSGRGTGWRVDFGGSVKLPPQVGVSFRAPNLSVTYVLCFSVNIGGLSNDLSPLMIPVELINCPPLPSLETPPPPLTPEPPPPSTFAPAPAPPLPARHDPSSSRPVSTTSDHPGSGARPELPPRHSSKPAGSGPLHLGPTGSNDAAGPSGPHASSSRRSSEWETIEEREAAEESRAERAADGARPAQGEEAELEALYGLPPSYFDVVGEDESTPRTRARGPTRRR